MNGRIDHWFLCDWFKTAGAAAESRRIKIFYCAISMQEPHGRGCGVGLRAGRYGRWNMITAAITMMITTATAT